MNLFSCFNLTRGNMVKSILMLILLVCFASGNVKLTSRRRTQLPSSYVFRNISNSSIETCLENCLKNCSCASFQLCNMTECQLLSATVFHQQTSEKYGCIIAPILIWKEFSARVGATEFCFLMYRVRTICIFVMIWWGNWLKVWDMHSLTKIRG